MNRIFSGKRLVAFLSTLAVAMAFVPFNGVSAETEETVQLVNNIVMFAQFDPLSEKNFMESKTDKAVSMFNDDTTYSSLAKYAETISYGKLKVRSYFPQLENGVITPYILKQSRDEYTDYNQYAIEMIENISVPEDTPLDGNKDGYIDNIVLVVDGKTTSMADPLWAKTFHINGLNVNGCIAGSVNLMTGYTLVGSEIFNGIGTVCHEFLHSMGYPDLYRKDTSSGSPVGQWDIMSTASIFLQYPLAYQRYKVSGWLDAENITENGTYTLAPASLSEGNRLYILKTPLSDTEFFAVEYRKPGTRYSDELDSKIYGEGLVVYRINTLYNGNYRGDSDEIYVFRPDETELNAGLGDLTRSCYGGTDAPDHIGTTDLQKTFADGALVYTDGTNSGISINNISIKDDGTLDFSVEFADVSDKHLWTAVSGIDFPESQQSYDMTTGNDGNLYYLSATANSMTLYKIENDKLQSVTSPFKGTIYNPQLAFCGNVPYVMYQDNDYILHLCRWNEQSDSWTECFKGTETAQYKDITSDGSKIYFTYTKGSYPYELYADCYDPQTDKVSGIGSQISANACNMEIAVTDDKITIGFRDLADNNVPKAAVYNGNIWEITTLSESDCGTVSVLADDSAVWILPSGGKTDIYKMENGTLTNYPLPDELKERAFQLIPAVSDGKFYMAVNAQNPEEFSLYELNEETGIWHSSGNSIAREIVNSPVLAAQDNFLYCLYTASDQNVLLKKLQLTSNTEKAFGDIDMNGKTEVADIVILQKYLTKKSVLTSAQLETADINSDEKINIFDAVSLKRYLLS